MDKIVKRALVNSVGTFAYVVLIVSFIFSLQSFPQLEDTIFIPVAMLMLFVCSATITGLLVFGKPIMLYVDGKKNEAISLLSYTIGVLVLLTVLAFILLIVYA